MFDMFVRKKQQSRAEIRQLIDFAQGDGRFFVAACRNAGPNGVAILKAIAARPLPSD
jgi:hypothetical protein